MAEGCHVECHFCSKPFMLIAVILNVNMLSVVMLSVVTRLNCVRICFTIFFHVCPGKRLYNVTPYFFITLYIVFFDYKSQIFLDINRHLECLAKYSNGPISNKHI